MPRPASILSALGRRTPTRSEEHTSELQSQSNLVCRLLLEKKKRHAQRRSSEKHCGPHTVPPGEDSSLGREQRDGWAPADPTARVGCCYARVKSCNCATMC